MVTRHTTARSAFLPLTRLRRDASGSAAVEFAVVVLVILVLIAGVAELGRAIYTHHIATKAVRDATRYLSRVPDPAAAVYQDRATNFALRGTFDPAAPFLMPDPFNPGASMATVVWNVGSVDNSAEPPPFNGPATIHVVQAVATVPFTSPLLSLAGVPAPITMTVAHTERHIGE